MKYPSSFIDRVRSHFTVSEVIGRRIPVKRHGREFQALCPFHNEKTPSFTINDDKGFYHCFGCGVHGDVITFVKEYDGVGWAEALERLARDAGIALPVMTQEQQVKMRQLETLYDVMEEAANWFEAQLASPAGRLAQDYIQGRGLLPQTLRYFRIGYSLPQRDALVKHLLSKGVSMQQILAAGLAIKPDNGQPYDRFRGRLIFPIKDVTGRLVAFGGRLLSGDTEGPKYLNSPETELFKKGELLYHFSDARKVASAKKNILVTEGYMDTISLWQAGIVNVVAPLGTAMTEQHLQLLWRVAGEPVICLDGDAAGKRAMLRAATLAVPHLKPGKSLSFAVLPQGEDPDSLVRSQGVEAMRKLLKQPITLSSLLWDTLTRSKDFSTPEKRAALEKEIEALVAGIQDATVRAHYQNHFKSRLWEFFSGRKGKPQINVPMSAHELNQKLTNSLSPVLQSGKRIIKLVILYPELLARHEVEETFSHLELDDLDLERLRSAVINWHVDNPESTATELSEYLKTSGHEVVMRRLLSEPFVDAPKKPELALHFWQEVQKQYHHARVKEEERLANNRLAQEMTDEALEQFSSLRKISTV